MTQTVHYTEKAQPHSSAIDEIYYDDNTEQMFVKFKAGNIAGYRGVTRAVFNEFKNSNSVGKYYSSWIRGNYTGVSGDVDFAAVTPAVAKADHTHKKPNQKFTVEIQIIERHDFWAGDAETAVAMAKKEFDGEDVTLTIRSVTQHFNS
jgi:hypothetical protein